MALMQKILFVLMMLGLLAISFYSLNYLQYIYLEMNDVLIRIGVILIFTFTLLIIARYLLLIFFSLLNLIQRTAAQDKIYDQNEIVSIIVPCYNEESVIVSSLTSLLKQDYKHLEIIVVDDGSRDRTYELARSLEFDNGFHSLKVFSIHNGGKSRALNFGIKEASGSLICCVDADSRLRKDAIRLLTQHFDDEQIAAVAGSVYVVNRDSVLTRLQALEYIEGLNMARNGQAFLKLVNIIPGPIGMFRKSAMAEVGYYDHDTYAEDCDLTLKLIDHHYKIDFEPDAVSYTEVPENLLDLLKQRYRWTRGILQSIHKHRESLWNIKKKPSMSFVMWYMLFESMMWPFMQLWGDLFMIYLALELGVSELLLFWWLMFTVLDIAGALYCLLVTKEDIELAKYAVIYRLFFISVINIAKVFATLEEWFNVKMGWGKLERKGRI